MERILPDQKIEARDASGAAHRLIVQGRAKVFLANGHDRSMLRDKDWGKEGFPDHVRQKVKILLDSNLEDHILLRHLEPGQSTPLAEEALFWDIKFKNKKVDLGKEVAQRIIKDYEWLSQLPENAHRRFPIFLDGYSLGHAIKANIYTELIARKINDPHLRPEIAGRSGFFHDFGKMDLLVNSLVRLDRRLTPEEYEKVKLHPLIGAEEWIRLKRGGFLEPNGIVDLMTIFDGILEHHLRPDGKGYPEKIEIGGTKSLVGEIIAVADSFDAMTSDRKYVKRRANPIEYAREELKRCSGLPWDKSKTEKQTSEYQFEPLLVEALLGLDPTPLVKPKPDSIKVGKGV